jgi:quinoprotein glucose dehydrogenase
VNSNEQPWILTMIDVASEPMTPGRMAYAVHCLYCHGPKLAGDPLGEYPALVGLAARRTPAQVRELVRAGKGRMPAFAFLDEERLEAVVRYVRGEEDASAAAMPPTAGREVPRYVSTGYHRFVDPDGYPAITPPWGQLTAIDLSRGEIAWQIPFGKLPELEGAPTGAENYGGPVVTAGGLLFIGASKDETFRAFDKSSGELLWETKLPAAGYATPATYAVEGRQYVVIAAGGGKLGTRSGDAWVAFALPEG